MKRLYSDPTEPEYDYMESLQSEEPEGTYRINRDLNLAHRIVEETGANLFLTGKAGTGKTTFLRRLRNTSSKRMVVLAPTGVAAINAEGSTIHSFFQLSFSPFIPGKGFIEKDSRRYNFSKEKRRIIASLDLLVIDEISMVRPDTLDAIDDILRRYRNPALPFGGVQLLLIGDLRQLAPVVKDNEREMLAPYYPSEYFFESHALRQSGFVTIELSTIYRQSDSEFISILNAVRDGKVTMDILNKLNSRYLPGFNSDKSGSYIRLTTHNRMADDINYRKLDEIKSAGVAYQAVVKGNFPESSYPADFLLRLKIGAQVRFIKNDSGIDRLYYNGMLGVVTGLEEDTVIVQPTDGRPPISVGFTEWENTKYIINEQTKEITPVTDGSFFQIPLRLAWAITIHKSQGLTFDKAIIDAGYSFAPGQTYVALSRCRSLEGLVLGQPIPFSAVITDNKVNTFIESAAGQRPEGEALDKMRAEYARHSLAELFDFRSIKIAFDDFHRAVSEYVVPIYPDFYKPFHSAAEIVTRKVDQVGSKFTVLYASHPVTPEQLQSHPEFLEKIKNGCAYFLSLLEEVMDVTDNVNVKLDNSTYVTRLTNAYETVSFRLKVKYNTLKHMADISFSTQEYIKAKAHAVIEASANTGVRKKAEKKRLKEETGKKKASTKEPKEKKPVGYSKRKSLEMYLDGKALPEIATERNLAVSTIASHLGEFIASGELDPAPLFEGDNFRIIEEAFSKVSTYKEVREMLEGKVSDCELSLYYNGIVKPKKENN